jgi:hypothetical protein
MQFNLTIDMTGQPISAILNLLYSFMDGGNRFVAASDNKSIIVTLDGAKALSKAEYEAATALPYTLSFAAPPAV